MNEDRRLFPAVFVFNKTLTLSRHKKTLRSTHEWAAGEQCCFGDAYLSLLVA